MRNEIVFAEYDETNKTSLVTIRTPIGDFTGKSKAHEEDFDVCSGLSGQDIAFMKAYIKALKAKRRQLTFELKGMQEAYNALEGYTSTDKEGYEMSHFRKQIRIKKEQIEDYSNIIYGYENSIRTYPGRKRKNREKFIKTAEKLNKN